MTDYELTHLGQELEIERKRWNELDVLLDMAKSLEPESKKHRSICRSIAILICSHFEGSMKGISKSIVRDMAEGMPFSAFPEALQTKYTQLAFLTYEEASNKDEKKIRTIKAEYKDLIHIANMICQGSHIIDVERLQTAFDHCSHFTVKEMRSWAKLFGASSFSRRVNNTILLDAFSDKTAALDLLKAIEQRCLGWANQFPYGYKDLTKYGLDIPEGEEESLPPVNNFFDTLLSSVFDRRHRIAHGSEISSSCGVGELEWDIIKIRVLICAYALIVGNSVYFLSQ